ncbi:hypothetical protein NOR_07212 [Metarhizium rileyi]|uniref:Uncharacterized protein n=1 Tax=Metarhizium rileyi (strain RCEF 4871) TaxID=1649241 RepID=A0A166YRT0_METRR|nr:hypothetical protein NOR_07212 [Metarhizium rileyi RCEF 4871]TWU71288.1 hypothetical protein ED733_001510 [Metarhizium rileyi]
MKFVVILAMPSILAIADPLLRREEAQPAARDDGILTLRASFCIKTDNSECQQAVVTCQDESKIIEDCIRDEHPTCIEDESSLCSRAVVQCLDEFAEEEDAEQAVKDCIVDKVILGSPSPSDDMKPSTMADHEILAPSSPEQVDACRKASFEYGTTLVKNNCNGFGDDESSEEGDASEVCKEAGEVFHRAWTANNCRL